MHWSERRGVRACSLASAGGGQRMRLEQRMRHAGEEGEVDSCTCATEGRRASGLEGAGVPFPPPPSVLASGALLLSVAGRTVPPSPPVFGWPMFYLTPVKSG